MDGSSLETEDQRCMEKFVNHNTSIYDFVALSDRREAECTGVLGGVLYNIKKTVKMVNSGQ